MDLRPSEEARAFRDSVRGTIDDSLKQLADGSASELAPIDDLHLWNVAREAGWLDLAAPTDLRDNLFFAAVLMEELGRASLSTPVSEALVANAVLSCTGEELTDAGDMPAIRVLALPHARGVNDIPAFDQASGSVTAVPGLVVPWAAQADLILLPVQVGDTPALAVLSAGTGCRDIPRERVLDHDQVAVFSPADRADATLVPMNAARGEALWDGLALGRLLRAWELLGNAYSAMEMTAAHVQTREQFGRTLASMQAVQLHLADMWLALEAAELLVGEATDLARRGEAFAVTAECAAFAAGRAAEEVTQTAILLHGGVGYMWEYELHWRYRRVRALRSRLGTKSQQLRPIADAKLAEIAALPYPSWPRKGDHR